jgi:hypothetical protein
MEGADDGMVRSSQRCRGGTRRLNDAPDGGERAAAAICDDWH